tara:strand:- start:516 stop:809 length:294 start_codon:yes stop_codon:yes gene_type:complete
MDLQPSTNPLGSPMLPNAPIGNMFQPNDAEVKIPELGKKREITFVRPHQPLDETHPQFTSTYFIPISNGYPDVRQRKRRTSPGRVATHNQPAKMPKL